MTEALSVGACAERNCQSRYACAVTARCRFSAIQVLRDQSVITYSLSGRVVCDATDKSLITNCTVA